MDNFNLFISNIYDEILNNCFSRTNPPYRLSIREGFNENSFIATLSLRRYSPLDEVVLSFDDNNNLVKLSTNRQEIIDILPHLIKEIIFIKSRDILFNFSKLDLTNVDDQTIELILIEFYFASLNENASGLIIPVLSNIIKHYQYDFEKFFSIYIKLFSKYCFEIRKVFNPIFYLYAKKLISIKDLCSFLGVLFKELYSFEKDVIDNLIYKVFDYLKENNLIKDVEILTKNPDFIGIISQRFNEIKPALRNLAETIDADYTSLITSDVYKGLKLDETIAFALLFKDGKTLKEDLLSTIQDQNLIDSYQFYKLTFTDKLIEFANLNDSIAELITVYFITSTIQAHYVPFTNLASFLIDEQIFTQVKELLPSSVGIYTKYLFDLPLSSKELNSFNLEQLFEKSKDVNIMPLIYKKLATNNFEIFDQYLRRKDANEDIKMFVLLKLDKLEIDITPYLKDLELSNFSKDYGISNLLLLFKKYNLLKKKNIQVYEV